jgi:hypothetical protein
VGGASMGLHHLDKLSGNASHPVIARSNVANTPIGTSTYCSPAMIALFPQTVSDSLAPRHDDASEACGLLNPLALKHDFLLCADLAEGTPALFLTAGEMLRSILEHMPVIAGDDDCAVGQARLIEQGIEVVELADGPGKSQLVGLGEMIVHGI